MRTQALPSRFGRHVQVAACTLALAPWAAAQTTAAPEDGVAALQEVQVLGTAEDAWKQAPGVSTVTQEDLEAQPSNDLADIVRRQPGVNLTGNSTSGQRGNNRQIDLRGMGPENTLILIDGKRQGSSDYFETINPATQEVLADVGSGAEKEVAEAVAAAKEAFPKWAATPATERARIMHKLGDLITQHVPELAETETNDTGQVISQTGKGLVPRAAHNFHYFAEMCTRVDGHTYPVDDVMLNYTLYHPVGPCALISPWNVPFMTATWKTAPCLAFGNTAVIKMSELSPMTVSRLGQLALEAGVPAGVLNIVHGFGKEAGEALVQHRGGTGGVISR